MLETLPIKIFEPDHITDVDEEILLAMTEHPPASKFSSGDLAYLKPGYVRNPDDPLPSLWQVRFVVSAWQHELMMLANSIPLRGIDHAMAIMDRHRFERGSYEKPWLYCHGFPHGLYPDTAKWYPERALRRVTLRERNQEWETILDEAHAPFVGVDTSHIATPYHYDLAPDLYSSGANLGRPFSFEEATVHTAALLGLEPLMFSDWKELDPQHDIFSEATHG